MQEARSSRAGEAGEGRVQAPRGDYSFEEHTGEVQVSLHASTIAELFVEAGRALAALMLDQASSVQTQPTRTVTVTVRAESRAGLLVEWLNELIFQVETKKAVFTRFDIQKLTDEEIVATIHGVPEPPIRTAVKAATLHGLQLREEGGELRATVVLDV
jgi:SHS2 domain-containing protein